MPAATLTTTPAPAPPRALYGGVIGAACVLAALAAAGMAAVLGGDGRAQVLAAAAVGAGSVVSLLPVLFSGNTSSGASPFGLLVLFASGARLLAVLSIALVFDQTRGLGTSARPFWLGAMTGAGLVLMVESAMAVIVLSKMERSRAAPSPLAPLTN